MQQSFRHRDAGFTLIELMIVVAVIAVLLTIGVPTYRDYMLRGHRANAQAVLTEIAGRQQQFLLDRRAYASTLAELNFTVDSEVAKRYDLQITIPVGTVPAFTVSAVPKDSQVGDSCGTLSIDQSAARLPAGCW